MTSHFRLRTVSALTVPLFALAFGCSADGTGGGGTGGSNNNGVGLNNGTGADGTTIGGIPGPNTGGSKDDPVCDEEGNCFCISLALLGTLDSAADDSDTSVFVDWLNNNSGGTALATLVSAKPTITAEWLAQFNVIVVANINSWAFTDAEIAAVAEWTKTGGGIINLTGFVSDNAEPAASAQLISWAGLGYSSTWSAETGEDTPVYFRGGSTNLKQCLFRPNEDAHITTPVKFTPQEGDLATLTSNLDYVGAFIGWGVEGSGTVVATDPTTTQAMAMAQQVDEGRIFVWGDEWVVFGNQWVPGSTTQDETCKIEEPLASELGVTEHSVQTLYQTKQFWFNAINWVGDAEGCFEVTDDFVK